VRFGILECGHSESGDFADFVTALQNLAADSTVPSFPRSITGIFSIDKTCFGSIR
jgi:hypothetical protein